jgi:hypothetical protein
MPVPPVPVAPEAPPSVRVAHLGTASDPLMMAPPSALPRALQASESSDASGAPEASEAAEAPAPGSAPRLALHGAPSSPGNRATRPMLNGAPPSGANSAPQSAPNGARNGAPRHGAIGTRARADGQRASAAAPPSMPPAKQPFETDEGGLERSATAPQLRRFIKSRAYVPMHELRRRFAINGGDDEVTPVDLERQRVFVGLPEREGRLLAELLRGGDIGFELSLDPVSPIVVGVYPMRPVTRA